MKVPIIVLCFSVFLNVNAMESDHFKKITRFVGNVGIGNIAVSFEEIDNVKNVRNFQNELNIYSILKELLSHDSKINYSNITEECRKAGESLLLPIIKIPRLGEEN